MGQLRARNTQGAWRDTREAEADRSSSKALTRGEVPHLVMSTENNTGRLNTAFVERVNLTLRQSVAALSRRTWSTARSTPRLLREVAWWRAYYHFIRPHQSLRLALPMPRECGGGRQAQRFRARTPAMAARITTRRWSPVEVLLVPCGHRT
jgi:hypothetical protein